MKSLQRRMTAFLRKTLRLDPVGQGEHATDYQILGEEVGGLGDEYHRLVLQHLQRWGVHESCATVEIQQLAPQGGKDVFVASVCLRSWDRNAALRVLLGLPLLDQKIRKAAQGLWLADVSIFQGVVLKVAEGLHGTTPSAELRHLIVSLTGPRETYGRRKSAEVTIAL